MVKFGYPGPKLEAEWDYFLTTAEEQLREHNEFMEEALELKRIADEKHAELRSQREARWAEEQDRIKKERYDNQQEFLKWTEPLLPTMNSWESNARHQIAQRIGMGTPLRGYTRTVQQWKSRLAVQEGAEVDHPVYNQLNELDVDKLNDWEKNFRQSIMGQLADGKELSPKQAAAISRMMEKFKPTIES